MNPQYEEHLRDSQFDDSRFAGFCRGDVYRPANGPDPYFDMEDLDLPDAPF